MAELKPKVKPKACISLNCLFAHMSAHLSRARSGRARLRHPGRRLRFAQFVLLQHLTGGHCLLAEAASKPAERGEGPVLRCHCTCLAHAHCLMPEAGPLSCQERRAGLQSASMVRLQMLSALPCARSGLARLRRHQRRQRLCCIHSLLHCACLGHHCRHRPASASTRRRQAPGCCLRHRPCPRLRIRMCSLMCCRSGGLVQEPSFPPPPPPPPPVPLQRNKSGKGQHAVPATMTLFWKICIATAQAGGRAATSGRTKTSSGTRQNLSVQHMRTMLSNESFSTEAGPRACPRSQPRAGPAEHGHRVGPQHE